MRKDATKGFTLNEHGLYEFHNRVKGRKLKIPGITSRISHEDPERPIFDFLNYEHREPHERRCSRFGKKEKSKIVNPCGMQNQEIKTLLISYRLTVVDTLTDLSLETLSSMCDLASKAYYNEKPIIGDGVFDILKEHTKVISRPRRFY